MKYRDGHEYTFMAVCSDVFTGAVKHMSRLFHLYWSSFSYSLSRVLIMLQF